MDKINNIVRVFPKAVEKNQENIKQITPAFERNNVSVVFASDNNYVPYLSVAMHSLLSHINSSDNYDIVILSDNISDEYKSIICQDCSFHNVSIRFFEVSSLLNSVSFQIHNKQLSRSTFTRLFCLDIFKNYEKILYLDCDIIVNTDISDLFKNDMTDNYILAVPDNHIETVKVYQKNVSFHLQNYVKRKSPYFNAGVIMLNLEALKAKYTSKKLIDIALSREWLWEDQDVLNSISDGKTMYADFSWNVIWVDNETIENMMKMNEDYLKGLKFPKIIHFAGGCIPTKHNHHPYHFLFWKYARQSPFYEYLQKIYSDVAQSQNFVNVQTEIKVLKNKYAIRLFNFLPLFTRKQRGGKKSYKFFGLPFFTVRRMENGFTVKYYILGIPLLKISCK